ncbi:MAG: endopeptidase La [Bryobacteraceae bacterium]|nr:endopeptidase La [Bryobacteraceae bacterium]
MKENVQILPVLPLKNTVLLPELMLPLQVGREASRAAVQAALASEAKELVVVAQRKPDVESPGQDDLYTIGTKAIVRKVSTNRSGALDVLVYGEERVAILRVDFEDGYLKARVNPLETPVDTSLELEALQPVVFELATKAIALAQPQNAQELTRMLAAQDDPIKMAYLLAATFDLEVAKVQQLLEAPTRLDALRLIHGFISHELQVLELRAKIAGEAQSELTKEQKEYVLRRQLKAIQQELGETDSEKGEVEQLRQRLAEADLPDDVRKEAERELNRMEKLPPAAPDYHVLRSYVELILELPWRKSTEDQLDIARAREILDADHYGLKDVKERILEHLGVLKRNPKAKAPILCFVGPPGVGKTSLGQSIARALGRKFERMSLGGLHDEAELRGHRRTYIGAMPGRLIQAVRRAGANNPVLMLDEVDKLGRDFRGDPASALLEVLDPEQNNTFRDNYLDLPFDLSKVLFITTANTLDTIPQPLLDRMEVLRLSGYTEEEKIEIAQKYLIPRQLEETGLTPEQCTITPEALSKIITGYTREAGLRKLERSIGRIARKVTLKFAEGHTDPVTITANDVEELLGPEPYSLEQARKVLPPGVATGLAWTPTGGDVLYIEGTLLPSGKGLTLTGQLGEVMQESARAAQSYIWSHAADFGIDPGIFKETGVHIHVPAGAVPKDGPSAGITAAVALASLYTGTSARSDTAMTGEITLTGMVLPIGGVKEKVLAARRAGIKRVILPKGNQKDLKDLPESVLKEMEFRFVERIEDVLIETIPTLGSRLDLNGNRQGTASQPARNGPLAAEAGNE